MLEISTSAEYYASLGTAVEDATPDELGALTRDVCGQRFRRIDRFTQLALIGSARCVGQARLPAETGLFIGSGLGAVGNTVAVHEHLFVERKVPRPADFVNTLSNSAGYYVAKHLGLTDQNIFVSRRAGSTVAAFEMAALEIATGSLQVALIGLVDEVVAPARHHAYRLGVGADADLAEGSHWFVTRAESAGGGRGRVIDARTVTSRIAAVEWLSGVATNERVLLNLGPTVDPKIHRRICFSAAVRARNRCLPLANGRRLVTLSGLGRRRRLGSGRNR